MNRTIGWIAGGSVVLLLALIWYAFSEERKWREFAAENNCKIVEQLAGSTDLGLSPAAAERMNTVVLVSPSTTAYLCDDGVTYWR